MIVISGALVLLALVLLVAGLAASELPLVYGSIVVSLAAVAFLAVATLQRRKEEGEVAAATDGADGVPPLSTGEPVDITKPAGRAATVDVPAAPAPAAGDDLPPLEDEADEELLEGGGPVLIVAGRPRYHVEGCRYLAGKEPEEVDVLDARDEGFTPCGVCKPDEVLAELYEEVPTATVDPDVRTDADVEVLDEDAPGDEGHVEQERDDLHDDGVELLDDDTATRTLVVDVPAGPSAADKAPATRGSATKAPATKAPATRAAAKKAAAASAAKKAPGKAPAATASAAEPGPAGAPRTPARSAAARGVPAAAKTPVSPAGPARPAVGAAPAPTVATTAAAAKAGSTNRTSAPAARPAPSVAASAAAAGTPAATGAAKRGAVVVIPDRGKFHRPDCRYVRGAADAQERTRAQATRQGFDACGVCKP